MERVLDAIEVFFERLAAVDLRPLLVAVCLHVLKMACTSRAWRNVIAAAYPAERVRWRAVFGAYVAGVGVNAILPARGGDLLKLYLAHRALPASTYVTLGASLLVLSIFDSLMGLAFLGYALTLGVLPSFDVLDRLPSFDFAWLIDHERVSLTIVALLLLALVVGGFWAHAQWQEFKAHVGQAFSVLSSPARYLVTVALWQLCDWTLRLCSIWFFLDAFDIDQSIRNVLLVQVTASLATLVPVSPGGIGTEQAFLFYVFRGEVPRAPLLAYSVGQKLTLTAVNVAVGFTSILLTLGTLRFRRYLPRQQPEV